MHLRFVHLTIVSITLCHATVLAQTSDPIALLPSVESETISNRPRAVVRLPLPVAPEVEAAPVGGDLPASDKETVTDSAEIDLEIVRPETKSWVYPGLWRTSEIWDGGFEIGLNGANGNSDALSLTTGINASRQIGATDLAWDVTYVKTESGDVISQHHAIFNADYQYRFEDCKYSWFNTSHVVYDEFKAFDLRLSMNSGGGYDFLATERTKLIGRFGAGWSREVNGPDNRFVPEATFGGNFEQQVTARQKLKVDLQYLPEWQEFSNYRVVTDAHWKLLLDQESNLHLKIGLVDRYDSTSNGAKPNDLTYSVLLLWKI